MVTTLPIGAAALMLGVCVNTLRAWHTSGFLVPIYRTKGGHRRYDPSDVAKIMRGDGEWTVSAMSTLSAPPRTPEGRRHRRPSPFTMGPCHRADVANRDRGAPFAPNCGLAMPTPGKTA
jgi:hypothetical protein